MFSKTILKKVAVITRYDVAGLSCVRFFSALTYQWYKDNAGNFVRPSLQPYLFISALGKLYFSEVTRVDEGEYFCVATLSSNYGDTEIKQTPSRTSLPTRLQILDGSEWISLYEYTRINPLTTPGLVWFCGTLSRCCSISV